MNARTVNADAATWATGPAREEIERDALPLYLRQQRWFSGKARTLRDTRLNRMTRPGDLPGTLVLAIVEATFDDGGTDLYFLPLAVSSGPEADRLAEDRRSAIARLGDSALLHDALADPEACRSLLEWMAKSESLEAGDAHVRGFASEAFDDLRGPREFALPVRVGSAEQSNSTVIFGDRLILKLFRRLEPGVNPDYEIGLFLTDKAHFDRIPKTAGAIELAQPGKPPSTLAILQGLVANQGTGWEYALNQLREFYADLRDSREPAPEDGRPVFELAQARTPASAIERFGPALHDAEVLGRRTAEMHLALASDADDPAFRPEPYPADRYRALAQDVREQVERSLSTLKSSLDRLSGATLDDALAVLDRSSGLLARLDELAARSPEVDAIRVHGDYHLGQVLRVKDDYVILDFEGEPARPLAKRLEKQLPVKDVVGMLRSFDYAAFAGLFAASADDPSAMAALSPWARAWRDWTSASFLRAYLESARGTPFLPRADDDLALLLSVFTIDKALYELLYELNNRPDWVRIPLQGILAILGGPGAQGATT